MNPQTWSGEGGVRVVRAFPRAIAGRYRPQRQLAVSHLHTLIVARDRRTGVDVVILSAEAAISDRVLTGATAARAISDPRIPRVLDIVEPSGDDPRAHVITQLRPGDSWRDIAAEQRPTVEFVRAIIAHTAQALEVAAATGVSQGRLRPEHILVTDQGLLSVLGLGTQAALAGVADVDAARADVRALVALLYAGLTGTWPLPPEIAPKLPSWTTANRSGSLAAVTSTRQPKAVADQVDLPPATLLSGRPVAPAELNPGVPDDLNSLCVQVLRDGVELAGAADLLARLAPWSADLTGGRESATEAASAVGAPARRPLSLSSAASPSSVSNEFVPAQDHVATDDDVATQDDGATRDSPMPALAGESAAQLGGSAMPARVAAVKGAAVKASSTAVKAGNTTAIRLARRLHPDIPTLTPQERHTRTKSVATVLGAVMAVALILSLASLRGLGQAPGLNEILGGATPDPTAFTSPKPSPTAAAAPVAPAIASVATRDPLGDNEENDDRVGALVDANPESTWASSTYRSAAFSGIKPGMGVLLTLAKPATLSTLKITQAGQGGALEVRDAPKGTFEGSTVLTKVPMDTPTTTITLGQKPTVSKVLVWFTEVPRTNGRYRIELREISVG